MDSGHLISLKVMRVSRPSLGSAWEPFYSSSPSLSAHSTASITSLQGRTPLPGHPKTLRDLTHISELLTLPSSFGAIQLGETFSSCLSVNNDANLDVEGVTIHVEMQTASTKTLLAEFGGPDQRLGVGQSLEKVVSHEIKELGQHVLGCTVSYRMPPGVRSPPGQSTDLQNPSIQSFRKFYKFAVTNPLSVKTKVHLPRSPTAILSSEEREKVLLEVHIQNLTQDAMWLERMQFECVDGWQAQDTNFLEDAATDFKESLFTGSTALMQPQDVRQYIYILTPIISPPFPITHPPGAILPLGRLDISWRSSFGEPGRLLTSTLSRRIPLIQSPSNPQTPPPGLKQPPSAIPLHLQRSSTISGSPSRVQSSLPPQRAISPPANQPAPLPYNRPGSPFRGRPQSTGPPVRNQAQSPGPPIPFSIPQRASEDIEVDLVVTSLPRGTLTTDNPFEITFKVTIQAPAPLPQPSEARRQRVVSLVIQCTHSTKENVAAAVASAVAATAGLSNSQGGWTPRMPSSGFSSPSPFATPVCADFPDSLAQRLLVASPRQMHAGDLESDGGDTPGPTTHSIGRVYDLPSPELRLSSNSHTEGIFFLGPSTLFLPALRLPIPSNLVASRTLGHSRDISDSSVESESENEPLVSLDRLKVTASQEFKLTYVPRKSGFLTVGGLRVLVVEDRIAEEDDHAVGAVLPIEPRVLKELEVIAEVWVKS